jgi:hypothetical protein
MLPCLLTPNKAGAISLTAPEFNITLHQPHLVHVLQAIRRSLLVSSTDLANVILSICLRDDSDLFGRSEAEK